VPVVGGEGCTHITRPAKPLKPRRDFGVVKVQMVAAVAADELEQPARAVRTVVAWAKRLAPQYRHQTMAHLTRWDYPCIRGVCARRPGVAMASLLAAITAHVVSRLTPGCDVRV